MSQAEKWLSVFMVLGTGVIVTGVAFSNSAIEDGAQGYLIGTAIFAFIVGNDMLKNIR